MTSHETTIKHAITFIENNLTHPLTLDVVAKEVCFSKFHFHRIFQSIVGVTLTEYIRIRRLAKASVTLLHTDERILDIALQFESQESFSRSFKALYKLPPGKYRKYMRNIIRLKGESSMNTTVKGWFLSGSTPFNYEMGKDYEVVHQGKASGYLESKSVQHTDEFSTMMQMFKADQFKEKRIQLTCFLCTLDVEGFAGMWMRIDDSSGDVLQFDNMSNRPIQGSTNWNHYSITLDVPINSAVISFGVLLSGRGKIWADQMTFKEVEIDVPATNLEVQHELMDEPTNLSFEEE